MGCVNHFHGTKVGGFLQGCKFFGEILMGRWRQRGEKATDGTGGGRNCRVMRGEGRPCTAATGTKGTNGGRAGRNEGEGGRRRRAQPKMAATGTGGESAMASRYTGQGKGGQERPQRGRDKRREGDGDEKDEKGDGDEKLFLTLMTV